LSICENKFIVTQKLSNLGKLILKFENVYQEKILTSIDSNFAKATGYNGWPNYDIFANITYYLCVNTQDLNIKKYAKDILEECANISYSAKGLYDSLQS
jgi:eukaryotic-like serine/threonine-protein kinase